MPKLKLDIWSDLACPWCYVGKRRLEAALAGFPHRDDVEVSWKSFELDPSAPRVRDAQPYAERLAHKYGMSVAQAAARIESLRSTAAADGLALDFDAIRPGNTFDAHRLLHLAAARGKGDAAKERFFAAYMTEGKAIGEPEVLVALATEVGLDEDDVRGVLGSDAYAAEVRADEATARENGIGGVPFFVFADKYGVSGAQPAEVLLEVLTRVWGEAQDEAQG